MADTWYYAQNGQQYGPVSGGQLQQLAAAGQLQPVDLVWQEGMPNWAPAGTITNLIPAHRLASPGPAAVPGPADPYAAATAGAAPYGGTPAYGGTPGYDTYEVERPRRKAQGMSTGALVGLIAGMIGVVVVVVVVIIFIVNLSGGSSSPQRFSLRTNEWRDFRVTFEGGKEAVVTVTSTGNSDVDLFIFRQAPPNSHDERVVIPACAVIDGRRLYDDRDDSNCQLRWRQPQTETLHIRVWNRMVMPPQNPRNQTNTCELKHNGK
jgi:hypothetical protein